ncbi:hypothetical protein BofuT4_uP160160.1 [Botrytis cinerea T4]|uniref:Uncharacterized protein n=1 Tax=Botryotinia fuckeliana (strain T4) TaxID=999810 RepID=G2YU97_BOTF4|nr:hypothetical protein BofuT4_uP160160.1 [Botrytis cinerea T4]
MNINTNTHTPKNPRISQPSLLPNTLSTKPPPSLEKFLNLLPHMHETHPPLHTSTITIASLYTSTIR